YAGPAGEGDELYDQHARRRGVGRTGSTREALEQRGAIPGGECGGKPFDRGERRRDLHAPDTGPGTRVPGTRRCAGSSPQGQEAEVHRLAAPCDGRSAPGPLSLAKEASCAGGGRRAMGEVWGGSGGAVAGPSRANPSGRVSRPTVEENVHRQSRWPEAATRDRRAGGQGSPTGRGDGSQRDLRRGLSGILLRVPAGAQPA